MTILNNLNLQPIGDEVDSKNWQSQMSLEDTIDVDRLEGFLTEAVKDMRRDPIWGTSAEKGAK